MRTRCVAMVTLIWDAVNPKDGRGGMRWSLSRACHVCTPASYSWPCVPVAQLPIMMLGCQTLRGLKN